jgi:transposase
MDTSQNVAQATKTGPGVAAFCEMVRTDRPHPEQGFRTCLGVLSLVKTYGPERVDAACQRDVTIRARTVTSIGSILKTGLDRAFLQDPEEVAPLQHANIRGGGCYH